MDDWYYVENDPGVPFSQIGNPLAGLSEDAAADVQCLMEGKAIGTASLSANVLARDTALRAATQGDATVMRTRLRRAATNVSRAMRPLIREDAQGIPRGRIRQAMRRLMGEWLGGNLTYNQMRLQSAQSLREFYEQMRQIGRRGAGLAALGASARIHREEESWFRGAVREELGYWHKFLEQINEGTVPESQVYRRLDNYVRAMRGFFESTRVQALPDNVLVYWIGPKKNDPTICEGCILMMEWSPFPKSQLPASPRDGSTACLTNCRHKVVVRVARNFNDVIRRANQLDRLRVETRRRPPSRRSQPRDRMVQRLKEAKEDAWHGGNRAAARARQDAVRAARPGGRAGNPFRGEKLPEVPRYRGRVGSLRMEGQELDEAATGDCYDAAVNYLMAHGTLSLVNLGGDRNERLILVHAEITGQGPIAGVRYGHAWVEDGDLVIDVSNGRDIRVHKGLYYQAAGLRGITPPDMYRYTQDEARNKMMLHRHFGPWDLKTSTGL